MPPISLHAFGPDALGDLDATGVAERIRRGEVSAKEVVQASIDRAERVNPQLNAIQFPCFDRALQSCEENHPGWFAGVPSFIKDNTHVQGLPTGYGTQAITPSLANSHDPFTHQFLDQGFICLGKSRLPEFGFNASTEFMTQPPTRNPWNLEHSSGASSGGSAALVAAGVVPLAHANDGGGSIRIPAACCGLVGLKPTRGRLRHPEMSRQLPINLAVEGILTRSVRDTANFYAEAEKYYRNPKLPAIGQVIRVGSRKLRIGLVYDSIVGKTDTETRNTVTATAALLQAQGHELAEVALPITRRFVDDFSQYWGFLAFMVANLGKHLVHPSFDVSKLDNLSQGLARLYRQHLLQTPRMLYQLKKTRHDYARMFDQHDLILSPVLGHTTPELGYLSPALAFEPLLNRLLNYVSFTPLNNIAGGPGISLPMGISTLGLPIGVHFSAADGDERSLLEIAFELETLTPWRKIQDIVTAS